TWISSLQQFSADNPYRITIKQDELETASYALDKVKTALAAGDPPDAWYGPWFDAVDFLVQGALVDIDETLKTEKIWRQRREDIFPLLRETTTWKGKLAGIPVNTNNIAVAYSPPVFSRLGLQPPKVDWTWDDLVAMGKRANNPPDLYGFGIGNSGGYATLVWFLQLYGTTGQALFNKDMTKIMLPTREAEQTARFIHDLHHVHQISPWPADGELLQKNKGAMEFQGSYRVPTFKQKDVAYGVQRLPMPKFGKPTRRTYGGGQNMLIFKGANADRQLAGARVAMHMTDVQAQVQQVTVANNNPVTRSALESKELKEWFAGEPELRVWIEESPYTTRINAVPSGLKLFTEMGNALQEYYGQKVGLSAALENMRRAGQQLLDEDLKR
ncbi:MAG TPA: extracellular solute-binding protein, partial [Chloroflexota bacterium]|nr:extracellular solute-binding protein [Chloroflexota bacterium]